MKTEKVMTANGKMLLRPRRKICHDLRVFVFGKAAAVSLQQRQL